MSTKHKILIVPLTTAATLTDEQAERERVLWGVVHAMNNGDITPEQTAQAGLALMGHWAKMDGKK